LGDGWFNRLLFFYVAARFPLFMISPGIEIGSSFPFFFSEQAIRSGPLTLPFPPRADLGEVKFEIPSLFFFSIRDECAPFPFLFFFSWGCRQEQNFAFPCHLFAGGVLFFFSPRRGSERCAFFFFFFSPSHKKPIFFSDGSGRRSGKIHRHAGAFFVGS